MNECETREVLATDTGITIQVGLLKVKETNRINDPRQTKLQRQKVKKTTHRETGTTRTREETHNLKREKTCVYVCTKQDQPTKTLREIAQNHKMIFNEGN